jgi:hypothetical protein
LTPSARPAKNEAVIPSHVALCDYLQFEKGYWTFRAERRWEGASLHDAETLRASGEASYAISVILQRPWDLLEEERACTDADLARAAMDRAIACLAVFDEEE